MDNAYIIAGLGNPGKKYDGTRHNIGFTVIDAFVAQENLSGPVKFGKSLLWDGRIGGTRIFAVKPQTYMNNSGQSLRAAADFYKVPPENILVISDDINLEEGVLRIRMKGSAGGHNGLKSIIAHLGSQDFPRIRVGVGGKPEGWDLADYVLGSLKGNDGKRMEEAFRTAADAAELLVTEGGPAAMNRYNTKPQKPAKKERPVKKEESGEKEGSGEKEQES